MKLTYYYFLDSGFLLTTEGADEQDCERQFNEQVAADFRKHIASRSDSELIFEITECIEDEP